MTPITSAMNVGQTGPDVANLQQILQLFITTGIITISDDTLINGLADEYAKQLLGSSTAAIIRLYYTQTGIVPSDMLMNDAFIDSVNAELATLQAAAALVVSGYVTDSSGRSLNGRYQVQVSKIAYRTSTVIGTVDLADNGFYSVQYATTNDALKATGGYQILVNHVATDGTITAIYTQTFYLTGATIRADVQIPNAPTNPPTVLAEYDILNPAVTASIGGTPISSINTADANEMQALATITGQAIQNIGFLVNAAVITNLISETGISSDADTSIFYALIREGLPNTLELLYMEPAPIMKQKLSVALSNNIVSTVSLSGITVNANEINDPSSSGKLDTISTGLQIIIFNYLSAQTVVNPEQRALFNLIWLTSGASPNAFLSIYLNYDYSSSVSFWDYYLAHYGSSSYNQYKTAFDIDALIGGNAGLMWEFYNDYVTDYNPQIIATLTTGEIVETINNALSDLTDYFFFPNYITGATDTDKINNYAADIFSKAIATYSTHHIASSVTSDAGTPFTQLRASVNTFMTNNPSFAFQSTSILDLAAEDTTYNFAGVEDKPAFINEVATVQRLSNITTSYPLMTALVNAGVDSAMKIGMMSKEQFSINFSGPAGGTEIADAAYDLGRGTVVGTLTKTTGPFTDAGGTGGVFAWEPLTHLSADWRNLFGSLDSCNCCDCQSVYSPSAYLTDLLNLLNTVLTDTSHDTDLYTQLIARRPDIINIQLTCKNANVALPYIDIVNELLEDLASDVIYNHRAYGIYARQTIADAATQRALPEYVNASGSMILQQWDKTSGTNVSVTVTSPYDVLRKTYYPWNAPYDYYQRQIEVYLGIAGVKSYEIAQRLSVVDKLDAFKDNQYCYQYLGISATRFQMITDELYGWTIANNNWFYGFTSSGSVYLPIPDPAIKGGTIDPGSHWMATLIGRIDVFLQQTGLDYNELLQVLDCYVLNPISGSTRTITITPITGADPETCDLSKLQLTGLVDPFLTAFLDKLHRFVKLQEALGWTLYQLDKAIRGMWSIGISASGVIDDAMFRALVQMKKVAEQLNLSIDDAVLLWKPIDELIYSNYGDEKPEDIPSEYTRLFRNPQLGFLNVTGFPFPQPATTGDVPSGPTLLLQINYLSGIFNTSSSELTLLINNIFPDGTTLPNLTILSGLYRETLIQKGLGLSSTDWLSIKKWLTNSAFFGSGSTSYTEPINLFQNPNELLRLIFFVNQVNDSGISLGQMNYLLLDQMPDKVADDTLNSAMNITLTNLRTQLKSKWNLAYDTNNGTNSDTDGKQLQGLLLQILEADKTTRLIEIVQNPGTTDAPSAIAFINSDLSFFLPNSYALVSDSSHTSDYIPLAVDRRIYVFNQLKNYVETNILSPLIANFFAKEFKIGQDISTMLLSSCISGTGGANGYAPFLIDTFINGTSTIDRWLQQSGVLVFEDQFWVLFLMHKTALIVTTFGLKLADVQYIWRQQPSALPNTFSIDAFPVRAHQTDSITPIILFEQWLNFIQWMKVRSFLGDRMSVMYPVISSTTLLNDFTAAIGSAFTIGTDDIGTLIKNSGNLLVAVYPADYLKPQLYLRIIDSLEIQNAMPATFDALGKVVAGVNNATAEQGDVNQIIQIVKTQYTNDQWLTLLQPLQDILRIERRDALVAFLLSSPPSGYEYTWLTSDDIFDTLMIDVEMMPVMSTTRILLAINTVQVWVDRVLLGLETGTSGNVLQLSKDIAQQWENWRKLYRVWEANREVFVYPENWIEPELRHDKTPFFLELENFLKQNDLTADNVEDAYHTYLERLDEVANLEIIGVYNETTQAYNQFDPTVADASDIQHVFGRTKAHPHIYYYRNRTQRIWSAWEKLDTQIDGDHFMPIVWKGRLRLYWLVFTKSQVTQTSTAALKSSTRQYQTPAASRWAINLAFTELKNGNWTAKQQSKDVLYSIDVIEEAPVTWDQVWTYAQSYIPEGEEGRSWHFPGALDEKRQFYFSFYSKVNSDGDLQFIIMEYDKCIGNIEFFDLHFGTGTRYANNTLTYAIADIIKNDSYTTKGWNARGYFTVKFNGISVTQQTDTYERNLFYDFNTGAGHLDLMDSFYRNEFSRYRYNQPAIGHLNATTSGYTHFPGKPTPLLGNAWDTDAPNVGSGKYITLPRATPSGYLQTHILQVPFFFYQDYINSFFVERVNSTASTGSNVGGTYRFHNFGYSRIDDFLQILYDNGDDGLDALLDRAYLMGLTDTMAFSSNYEPTTYVDSTLPDNTIDFSAEGAYSIYNWELFFHIPMLIANKLSLDQNFEAARKWYHYVFNPTNGNATSPADFWNFPQFYLNATTIPTIEDIMADSNLPAWINQWANDPFDPQLVAKTRISAFMKNAVLKYLDNLIAWADMLFTTDTRENITEATLLYILTNQLLGRRPITIPARSTPSAQSFASLLATGTLNAFGEALVKMESLIYSYSSNSKGGSGFSFGGGKNTQNVDYVTAPSMYYFCFPSNTKLLTYWDTISDRLFKIRNSENINGVVRDLALYDPPIDPALLVLAAASGLSLSDVINNINAPLPIYRFNVMSQKATELAQEVKSLGGLLLSALEKKDAEYLSLLRSSQEIMMLDLMTDIKQQQIQESVNQVNALQQQQNITLQRQIYYQGLINGGLNGQEQLQLDSLMISLGLQTAEGVAFGLAAILGQIPNVTLGAFSFGATEGGDNVGESASQSANVLGVAAGINSAIGSMAATKGSFARRTDEWNQQLTTATLELAQLDKQILAAQIRQAISELDLRNHTTQRSNAQIMDNAMHSKYTNEDLYDWMIGQISFTYFQAYQLAMDVAKRAERCYHYELPKDDSINYIQPAYWNSLKKGLLSGEQLAFDIKRMEAAWLEKNNRQLELSKSISLAALDPGSMMQLKGPNKSCTINIPEWLYDLDYPGQHMRRIKSVSVSIPCVTGPYTTVSCKLSLLSSKYRKVSQQETAASYPETPSGGDGRFQYQYSSIQSIATSHAQNDAGMFEFNFRDERYLPFEGAGVISTWKIELPAFYAQFDYDTISDIILTINYTAIDEGSLVSGATGSLTQMIGSTAADSKGLYRIFDLKHEFPNEWQQLMDGTNNHMVIQNLKSRLPYMAQAMNVIVGEVDLYFEPNSGSVPTSLTPVITPLGGTAATLTITSKNGVNYYETATITDITPDCTLTVTKTSSGSTSPITSADVTNVWMVLHYKLS